MREKTMKRKLLLICAIFALICWGGVALIIPAQAGIGTNSPTGAGLMKNGKLNTTDFIITGDNETKSAYSFQKGNTIYNGTGWLQANKKFKNADRAVDSRLSYRFDIPAEPNATTFNSTQMDIMPVADGVAWPTAADGNTYTTNLYNPWGTETLFLTANVNAKWTETEKPDTKAKVFCVKPDGTETEVAYTSGGSATLTDKIGYNKETAKAALDAGREYFTFWIETDMNGTLTFYSGYDAHDGKAPTKVKTAKITNAFTMPSDPQKEYNFALCFLWAGKYSMDNLALIETHAVNGTDTDTIVKSCDFEDSNQITDVKEAVHGDFLTDKAANISFIAALNEMTVTNPEADSKVVSQKKLALDAVLTPSFTMDAAIQLTELSTTRKVGIALGLDSYAAKLSAPKNGATLLHFTKNTEGKVFIGVDKIAADGTSTLSGELTELTGLTVGAEAEYIKLSITGKGLDVIDVKINDGEPITFTGLKLSGNIAFAQTGTGNATFNVDGEGFKSTGFVFKGNDSDTATVTSTFDGNWINSGKFAQNSNISPESHIVKGENTAHDITGITANDGKVGFYGTSTNARLMFGERQYADFVMQLDYTSAPIKQRGQLGTATIRYSPIYLIFGSEESPVVPLASTYALGIVDGNVAQFFWGAESILTREGKLAGEGHTGGVQVLSRVKKIENETAEAIPCFKNNPQHDVDYWAMPDPEGATYSLYNKTTRLKLVVINNNVALYAAEVGADGNIKGSYIKIDEFKVDNSLGYVGVGSDSPGWAEIDNMAITPITKEVALDKGVNAVPAVDLVADIAVANMAADPEPMPLSRPTLTADVTNKKVSWAAVAGASGYKVTVKLGTETKYESTDPQTGLEYIMSAFTADGDYKVTVVAIAADPTLNYDSNAGSVTYSIKAATNPGEEPGGEEPGGQEPGGQEPKKSGCGKKSAAAAAVLPLLGLALLAIIKKR